MEKVFSEKFYNEADTSVTIRSAKKTLKNNLKKKFPDLTPENINSVAETLMELNGLDFNHFNFLKSVERIISEKLNDVSIDDNSNKNEKTIEGIFSEATAPVKKAVGYDYLYRTMKELYGKRRAKYLTAQMYDYSLGLSDSTNILKPYCYAIDASKLVLEGRKFGTLPSKPAKRVSSYISALCETIHQMSSHLAGAIAIGTFFYDIAHLSLYKMDLKLENLEEDKCKKHYENEFQQFVHSVNHLSRNSNESPFTNLSVFDHDKIRYIVEEDLNWYFPIPSWYKGTASEWSEYVTEFIYKLQSVFLDFFDKGDPCNNGMPYRFPVVTANFSKEEVNGEYTLSDPIFLKDMTNRDIYRYNIFNSSGTKVASCCRLINDTEMLEMASQSNSFGAGALAQLGSHRVVTINFNRIALESESIEEFWTTYEKRIDEARDVLKAHKVLISALADKGLQMFIDNYWIRMDRLFSTFGILGIYEAAKTLSDRFGVSDLTSDILKKLSEKCNEFTKQDRDNVYNIEQIPGESYAVRLAKVDKILYGDNRVPYELYANQFVPLWEDASIWEKFDIDGKYNQLITGGGIVHATIGEKVTPLQAEKLIKYATKVGCEHFALNAVYSKCEEGHTNFGNLTKCPECGNSIVEKLSRVVGFFTPVTSWNKTRREWEFEKRTIVDM